MPVTVIVEELSKVAAVTTGDEESSCSKLHSSGVLVLPQEYDPEVVFKVMLSPVTIYMAVVRQVKVP